MKATVYFLVQVEEDYNNTIITASGKKMAINNSIDKVKYINRVGTIVDAPKGSNASVGDKVLFHHNICRRSWDRGKKRQSHFYVRDQIYYIPLTEIFLIKRQGSDQWEAIDPYVFLRPIEARHKKLPNGLEVIEEEYEQMRHLMGEIVYPSKVLANAGIKAGDMVAFQEESEYEFNIGGRIHYRMRTNDILGIYESN
jgi:co-chaperonin GroES (HSP10)